MRGHLTLRMTFGMGRQACSAGVSQGTGAPMVVRTTLAAPYLPLPCLWQRSKAPPSLRLAHTGESGCVANSVKPSEGNPAGRQTPTVAHGERFVPVFAKPALPFCAPPLALRFVVLSKKLHVNCAICSLFLPGEKYFFGSLTKRLIFSSRADILAKGWRLADRG